MTALVSIPSRAGFLAARDSGVKAVAAGALDVDIHGDEPLRPFATEEELVESAKQFRERVAGILKELDEKDVEWRAKMKAENKKLPRPKAPKNDEQLLAHLRNGPCKVGNPD